MPEVLNFSAGPAILPKTVLQDMSASLLDWKGTGLSVLEMSHRSKPYEAIHQEAKDNIRRLLDVPADYDVLFLQGGASLQFSMVPMNLAPGAAVDYTNTGSWAKAAMKEAKKVAKVSVIADTSAEKPARMPDAASVKATAGSAYVHVTSNETIDGTQWKTFPDAGVPLVADMSSDILSRPVDVRKFGLIYAGAQKNLGPSGVTIVIIRKDWAARSPETLPAMLSYKVQSENDSLYNTAPTSAIWAVMLVTRWLLALGGLPSVAARNKEKAAKLYAAIDASGYYRGTADKAFRSDMNVTFRLPSEDLENKFLKEAETQGFSGLKGHRSVGGLRASIYNAFPPEGVDRLVSFMKDFEKRNG